MMNSPRTEAIQIARSKLEMRPVYLDTETTGIGPADEVIEIGILDEDGTVLFESLVKPTGIISPDARRVHGIRDDDVASAPRWMTLWPQVQSVLSGRIVCVYNADFDQRLLQQTHAKYKIRWFLPEDTSFFCVMKLYAQFYGERNYKTGGYRWHSLDVAGRQCRLIQPNTHRAIDDCRLTRALLHYMAEQ
jgi:DNA polymerase-3 subunit epsilon